MSFYYEYSHVRGNYYCWIVSRFYDWKQMKKITKFEEETLYNYGLKHKKEEIETVLVKAPLEKYGYIAFVKLDNGWICSNCGRRSTIANFKHHSRRYH